MATGPEICKALLQVKKNLGLGEELKINSGDYYDLRKLRPSDLVAFGFDQDSAEKVSSALLEGDYSQFSEWIGHRLVESPNAMRLLPEVA